MTTAVFWPLEARLRAKIKYRPVVYESMLDEASLLQLQQAVEALRRPQLGTYRTSAA